MQLERLGKLKKPVTSSGIEPATLLLKIDMDSTVLKIVHESNVIPYKSFLNRSLLFFLTINNNFDQD
jgi:hypothetical protein